MNSNYQQIPLKRNANINMNSEMHVRASPKQNLINIVLHVNILRSQGILCSIEKCEKFNFDEDALILLQHPL